MTHAHNDSVQNFDKWVYAHKVHQIHERRKRSNERKWKDFHPEMDELVHVHPPLELCPRATAGGLRMP